MKSFFYPRLTVALKCYELGLFVVAGCLNVDSDGARKLTNLSHDRIVVTEIDIRNNACIEAARDKVNDLLTRNGLSMFHLKFFDYDMVNISFICNRLHSSNK